MTALSGWPIDPAPHAASGLARYMRNRLVDRPIKRFLDQPTDIADRRLTNSSPKGHAPNDSSNSARTGSRESSGTDLTDSSFLIRRCFTVVILDKKPSHQTEILLMSCERFIHEQRLGTATSSRHEHRAASLILKSSKTYMVPT